MDKFWHNSNCVEWLCDGGSCTGGAVLEWQPLNGINGDNSNQGAEGGQEQDTQDIAQEENEENEGGEEVPLIKW